MELNDISKLELPETGDELIGRVTALEKSQSAFASLLPALLKLLRLAADSCNTFPSQKALVKEVNHGFTPLDEWALKWLLKRMSSGEVGLESPAMDHRAWYLLLRLISRLNIEIFARILSESKLPQVLEATAECLHQLSSEAADPRSTEFTKHEAKSAAFEKLGNALHSVTRFLRHMDSGIIRMPGNFERFSREQARLSIQMSLEQAAKTLGNLLTAIRVQIAHLEQRNMYEVSSRRCLIDPALFLWQCRKDASTHLGDKNSLSNAVSSIYGLSGRL